ncbi:MAG: hypothetical protein KTR31_26435, partial [Myxococcales bacterium]|nr:hypothetical protein [Myxococcales bacterium]
MRNFYVGLLFSAAMLSCNGDNKDTDTDVVVDVDTDADTDADADTDTDADADTSDTNTVSCADLFFDPTVPSVVSGTTADDDEMGSCGGDGEADSVISFIAPFTGEFGFVLDADFNSVLYALDACDGDEVDCLDVNGAGGEILITTLAQGEELLLVVDGGVGDFDIGAYEVMKAETVCDDGFDDDFDTFADCSDSECWADKVCAEDCTDGLDDNDNGPIDCDDPVCATDAACIEICDDGIDNNKDGDIDCEDVSCAKELLCQAQCPDIVSAGVLPETLVGDTIGDIDEVQLIGKKGSGDVFIEYTAPQAGDYLFDLVGSDFDAALAVLDGCGGTELAFGDDDLGVIPSVPVNLALGQTVIIAIDGGEKNAEGNFVLNINEVELSESDCTDGQDLDADGLVDCFDLDCVGDKACIEICDNGKDDNGNGLADCFD